MRLGIALLACFLSAVLATYAFSEQAYRNEPDGFRGHKWGDESGGIKAGMTFVKASSALDNRSAEISWYVKEGDVLRIGNANASSIEYGFRERKLAEVKIDYEGDENFIALKEWAFREFGDTEYVNRYYAMQNAGDRFLRYVLRYEWGGLVNNSLNKMPLARDTKIMLIYNSKFKVGFLSFKSARSGKEQSEEMRGKDAR